MSWPFNTNANQLKGPNNYVTLSGAPQSENSLWTTAKKLVNSNFNKKDGSTNYTNIYSIKENVSLVWDYEITKNLVSNFGIVDIAKLNSWKAIALEEIEMMYDMGGGGGGDEEFKQYEINNLNTLYNKYKTNFVLNGDSNLFEIDSNTGVLKFKNAPDYESPLDHDKNNTYFLAVGAPGKYPWQPFLFQPLKLTITNDTNDDVDNKSPIVSQGGLDLAGKTLTASIVENITQVAKVSANETVTWSLTGPDANKFSINSSGYITFKSAPDYEKPGSSAGSNTYSFAYIAKDAANNETKGNVSVEVKDHPEGPVITPSKGSFDKNGNLTVEVNENETFVLKFGTPEAVTYDFGGPDASKFNVGATGNVTFKSAPDYENPGSLAGNNSYSFAGTAADKAGNKTQWGLNVVVKDVDEKVKDTTPPVVTPSKGSFVKNFWGQEVLTVEVDENETSVLKFNTPEAVTYTWIGPDASKFNVGATGNLTFKSAPDYENPGSLAGNNSYSFAVTAKDDVGNPTTIGVGGGGFGLEVKDEVAPKITVSNGIFDSNTSKYSINVDENKSNEFTKLTADETVTWSLVGTDADKFSIDTSGNIAFKAAPDFETPSSVAKTNSYIFSAKAKDSSNNSSEAILTVNVKDVDDTAPTITTPKTTIEIFVGPGKFSAPYYKFYLDKEGTLELEKDEFKFDKNNTYVFKKLNNLTSHPFYISDIGYNKTSSDNLIFSGDGSNTSGIKGDQSFTLSFKKDTNLNKLFYFCTSHSTMISSIDIADNNSVFNILNIDENTKDVVNLSSSENATWALEGKDSDKFNISDKGVISFKEAPDFEKPSSGDGDNLFNLQFTAKDSSNNKTQGNLLISVADVYEDKFKVEKKGGKFAIKSMVDNKEVNLKFNKKEVTTEVGDFELKKVDTIGEKNLAAFIDPKTKKVAKWELDESFNFVKGESYEKDDLKAFQLELDMKNDINGDGYIGLDKSKDGKFDNADLDAGALEQKGKIKSFKDLNENLYAGDSTKPVLLNGLNTKMWEEENTDWEIVGIDQNDISKNFMVIKEKASKKYALCNLGDDWSFESGKDAFELFDQDIQNSVFDNAEKVLQQDLNGDGVVGKKWNSLDQNGEQELSYDYINEVKVIDKKGGGNKEYEIKFKGGNIKYKYNFNDANPKDEWTIKETETTSDNKNWVVWQNDELDSISLWELNEEWSYKKNYFYSKNDIEAYQLETEFSNDFNGDSIIGLDSSKNGKFDSADLTGGSLEQLGDYKLLKDINNNLYAGSVSNPLFFSNKNVKADSLKSLGWEILGIDSDSSSSKNYMVIKESDTSQHALVDFGSDWKFEVGKETFELFDNIQKGTVFETAEKVMGQTF